MDRSRQWQTVDSDDDEKIDQQPSGEVPGDEGISSGDSRSNRYVSVCKYINKDRFLMHSSRIHTYIKHITYIQR